MVLAVVSTLPSQLLRMSTLTLRKKAEFEADSGETYLPRTETWGEVSIWNKFGAEHSQADRYALHFTGQHYVRKGAWYLAASMDSVFHYGTVNRKEC